jgi:hypothetical protein
VQRARRCGAFLRKRRRATEGVRGHGVRFGPPSRWAQGVSRKTTAKKAPCEPRRAYSIDQSWHGEKLWHREAGFGRANGATRHRKPTPNDDAARRRERRAGARLG